jgi:hypothetical protein
MLGLCSDGPLTGRPIADLPDNERDLPRVLEFESLADEDAMLVPIPPGGEYPEARWQTHRYEYLTITITGYEGGASQVIAHYKWAPDPAEGV